MNPRRALLGAGAVAGVAGVLAGGAWALERTLARRARARPDPDEKSDLALPPGPARKFPSHDGGTIATLEYGDGPTIVFSHGVTLSNRTWVKQFDALPKQGFRVVAFDHRGHGESKAGSSGHSIDNLADDVRTVLDALDVRDGVMVGHSMGGIAVLAYVTRHPEHAAEHLRGIVLLSTLYRVRISEMRRLQQLLHLLADKAPDLAAVLRRRDLGLVLARIGFGANPHPSHVELTRQMIAACAADTSRLAPQALLSLDLTPALPTITLPTLVVCGTSDVITPPAESRRIAELIPGARLELFPKAGHMLMLERAEELDALIVDFAREVGAIASLAG
ncbi:MAG: alpha/beta fold hydrolase [Acidimicrobiia bacterium]